MSEQEINKLIAKNLCTYLDKHNMTQAELAKYMNVSTASVSNWCKGLKLPRMDKIDKICEVFHCKRSDLMEEKTNDKSTLNAKDEKDIAKRLEKTLAELENEQNALMFSGEPLDDATRELLKASLENSIRIAKINAKQKFTPKKYRRPDGE